MLLLNTNREPKANFFNFYQYKTYGQKKDRKITNLFLFTIKNILNCHVNIKVYSSTCKI